MKFPRRPDIQQLQVALKLLLTVAIVEKFLTNPRPSASPEAPATPEIYLVKPLVYQEAPMWSAAAPDGDKYKKSP